MIKMLLALFVFGLAVLLFGCMIGYALGRKRKINMIGSLVLNYDDPNKDFLGFVFTRDLDLSDIEKSAYVSFKVVVEGSPDSNPKFSQEENS